MIYEIAPYNSHFCMRSNLKGLQGQQQTHLMKPDSGYRLDTVTFHYSKITVDLL